MTKTSKAWSLVVRIETMVWGGSKEAIRMSFTCEECTVLLEDAQGKPLRIGEGKSLLCGGCTLQEGCRFEMYGCTMML
jgi:hypothetical protein